MEHDLKHWGRDSLTAFFERAHTNNLAFFEAHTEEAKLFISIEGLFARSIECLPEIGVNETELELTLRMFLLMSHGSFMAAVRGATSGQLAEAYVLIRACLERGLYASYLAEVPEAFNAWWRRHEGDAEMKESKKHLKLWKMQERLTGIDPETGRLMSKLYEDAIDLGAHPNVLDTLTNVAQWDDGEPPIFGRKYLHYGSSEGRKAVARCLAAGVVVLLVFGRLYKSHFEAAGLESEIAAMQASALNPLLALQAEDGTS